MCYSRSMAGQVQDYLGLLANLYRWYGATCCDCHSGRHRFRRIIWWTDCKHHLDRSWYWRSEGMHCAFVRRTEHRDWRTLDNSKDWRSCGDRCKANDSPYLPLVGCHELLLCRVTHLPATGITGLQTSDVYPHLSLSPWRKQLLSGLLTSSH